MYYDELHVNARRIVKQRTTQFSTGVCDGTYMRTYRSLGPRSKYYSVVPDMVADPYAGFLHNVMNVRKRGGGEYVPDTGHPFVLRHAVTHQDLVKTVKYGNTPNVIRGVRIFPLSLPSDPSFPSAGSAPTKNYWTGTAAFGQEAISRVAPTPSIFNGSQFLGELREGLPSLPLISLLKGRVKDFLKNTGGEYLNVQFGLLPLIDDIKKLFDLVINVEKNLVALSKIQGKAQRRQWRVPTVYLSRYPSPLTLSFGSTSCSTFVDQCLAPPQSLKDAAERDGGWRGESSTGNGLLASGSWIETIEAARVFDGSFTSHFDYAPADSTYIEKLGSLINGELDLSTLWELTPWSWLIDWLFNVQSTIEANAIAGDERVIMNYGYVTEVTKYRALFTGKISTLQSYPVVEGNSFQQLTEAKFITRTRANPFGFQITSPSGFNQNQLAILAALGLSRA